MEITYYIHFDSNDESYGISTNILPHTKILKTFTASSYNQAMQIYYDYMGFGIYKPF